MGFSVSEKSRDGSTHCTGIVEARVSDGDRRRRIGDNQECVVNVLNGTELHYHNSRRSSRNKAASSIRDG